MQLLSRQCLPQRAATRLSPGWEKLRREQKPPNPAEGWADSFAWQRCRCGEQQGLWQRQQAQLPALTSCRAAGSTGPFSQAGAPRLSTPHPALCHIAPFVKIPAPGPLLQLGRLSVLPVCPGRANPGQALQGSSTVSSSTGVPLHSSPASTASPEHPALSLWDTGVHSRNAGAFVLAWLGRDQRCCRACPGVQPKICLCLFLAAPKIVLPLHALHSRNHRGVVLQEQLFPDLHIRIGQVPLRKPISPSTESSDCHIWHCLLPGRFSCVLTNSCMFPLSGIPC